MILEKALNGLPLDDIFIFDVHGHYGSEVVILQNDSDGIISTMDSLGVNAICVSSNLSFESDTVAGNELTIDIAKKHPGRIYGYVVPTPYYEIPSLENLITENPEILGIKIHASLQNTTIDHPGYIPAYEIANKWKLPLLFHAWNAGEAKRAAEVASKYQDATIILGHSGFTDYNTKLAAIEAIKKYDNVFIDTAISSTYEGALEWIVSKVGADRVLYGSDMPFFDSRHTLGKIALSKLCESDKIKILGANASRIFHLPKEDTP